MYNNRENLLKELLLIFKHLVQHVVTQIQDNQCPHCNDNSKGTLPKLYNKQEVMKYLKISERSYYRYKKEGILQVSTIGSIDYCTEEDMKNALAQSKRKGRI